jgi:hypothetical protein
MLQACTCALETFAALQSRSNAKVESVRTNTQASGDGKAGSLQGMTPTRDVGGVAEESSRFVQQSAGKHAPRKP